MKGQSEPSVTGSLAGVPRESTLDFLRGTAVIFMIITHVLVLFYRGASPVLWWLSWWGGVVSFTVFLFVFASIFGLKISQEKINPRRELWRAAKFLLVYYLLALWMYAFRLEGLGEFHWANILRILTFRELYEYTEFVLAFVWYIGFMVLARSVLRRAMRYPVRFIAAAVVLYTLGLGLYGLNWGTGYIEVVKAQLVGAGEIHAFGVISYLPVLVCGLIYGQWLAADRDNQTRRAWQLGGAMLVLLAILEFGDFVSFRRFPPSFTFLLYGLVYTQVVLASGRLIRVVETMPVWVGRHAFGFYVGHLLVLIPLNWYLT